MMRFIFKLALAATVSAELTSEWEVDQLSLLQMRTQKTAESVEELSEDDMKPKNACKGGIRVRQYCYASSCGRNGQQPGGRNCAALPGGANACCMTRITKECTGPNMDRCKIPKQTGMGNMGMGGMGGMGNMGMGGMGQGDEAEAVGDPHLQLADGEKQDLCCESGVCQACPPAMLQQEQTSALDELSSEEMKPKNACKGGIRVRQYCYAASCGRTGQQPGGRNCAALPGGANACCMTRITKKCTGPNMDRCKIPKQPGMGGMGGMGMGMGVDDEAEAVGDPHLTLTDGQTEDLCCEGGVCKACEQ